MNAFWFDIENPLLTVAGITTSAVHDEGKGIRFINQAQFSMRAFFIRGIEKNAAIKQITVEVGDQ